MSNSLSLATWIVLCGPMPLILLLALIGFLAHAGRGEPRP